MWQYNRKKKNHVEISWPAVVSVYSSHIRNVDLLNSNTGWFLTKLRSKKWYFLPLGWHNCDQCLGAVPGSVGQDRSKYNESAGSYLFCQSLCQLWLQSTHRQTMVFWHNWRSKQRHSVSSLTTRYVWTHTDGHLAFMEVKEENMQTARPQNAVHTSFHVKNVNWILPQNRQSSTFGATAHCGLRVVEKSPSIFPYLSPTLSIFSLPSLEHLFLFLLSILSWAKCWYLEITG